MKRLTLPVLATTAALLLSACSTLASLIPDQKVEVLGTQEELVLPDVQLQVEEPTVPQELANIIPDLPSFPTALQTQAKDSYLPFGFYKSVDDLKESIAITPTSLKQALELSQLTLSGGSEATVFPDVIELELVFLGLYLWDGVAEADEDIEGFFAWGKDADTVASFVTAAEAKLSLSAFAEAGTFKLNKNAASCSADTCSYSLDVSASDVTEFSLNATKIEETLQILSLDGDDAPKNSISVNGFYKVKTDLDASLSASLSFNTPDAIISFK